MIHAFVGRQHGDDDSRLSAGLVPLAMVGIIFAILPSEA